MFDLHEIERHLRIILRKCLLIEGCYRSEAKSLRSDRTSSASVGAKRNIRFAPTEKHLGACGSKMKFKWSEA